MKNILFVLILFGCISCGKDKVIQLPEISHSKISEITDVSAAYIFYNETQPDSAELNRKNLISTTNWLVNVDKRLSLKQVIPHIKFLQEKKGSSSHKNEKAKNYFTCSDTSAKNLGFIDFTDVVYHNDLTRLFNRKFTDNPTSEILIHVIAPDSIRIHFTADQNENIGTTRYSNKENLKKDLSDIVFHGISEDLKETGVILYPGYHENLSFQDYITIKSILSAFKSDALTISNNEFIFN